MPEAPAGGYRVAAIGAIATTETVVAVIPGSGNSGPTNPDDPNVVITPCLIRGVMGFTAAATGTGVLLKCYRNNAAAQAVGVAKAGAPTQVDTVGGQLQSMGNSESANVAFEFQDPNNPQPGLGYIVTAAAQTIAGVGNTLTASINDGS